MAKVAPDPGHDNSISEANTSSDVSAYEQMEMHKSSRTIITCLTNFQTALNGVLFAISKRSTQSFILVSLSMIVDFVQLFSLLMPEAHELDLGLPQELNRVAELAQYLRFGRLLKKNMGTFNTLVLAQAIVCFEFGNVLYVGYGFTNQKLDQLWAVKLLRTTMPVFVGVMFIPLLSLLTGSFACESLSSEVCMVLLPVSVILIPLYITLGLLISISNFDPFPGSKSPAARAHSRIDTLHLLMKASFVLTLSLLKATDPTLSFQVNWSIFTAIATTSLAVLFILYHPYFNPRIGLLRIMCSTALSWTALCILGHVYLAHSSDSTVVTTTLGGLPVILLLVHYVSRHRENFLNDLPVQNCWTPYDVELKCRLELKKRGSPALLPGDAISEIHNLYLQAMEKFPKSCILCVFHAAFLVSAIKQESPFLARRTLMLAHKRGLPIDLAFTVFKLNKILDNSGQSTDVMTYFKVEKYMRDSLLKDKLACLQLLEFWKELLERQPDSSKVTALAKSIGSSTAQAKAAYSNILRTDPSPGVKILRLFGTFLTDIANDNRLGDPILAKARGLETKQSTTNLDDISGGNIGVLVVNNDLDIVSANIKAAEILNIPSAELTRQTLNSIFVAPLHSACLGLMKNLIFLAQSDHFDKPFETFLITRGGNCVQVAMKLKPVPLDEEKFRLYVCFTSINRVDEDGFILCTKDMNVTAVSPLADRFFVKETEYAGRSKTTQVRIDALVPELSSVVEKGPDVVLDDLEWDVQVRTLANNSNDEEGSSFGTVPMNARALNCFGCGFVQFIIKHEVKENNNKGPDTRSLEEDEEKHESSASSVHNIFDADGEDRPGADGDEMDDRTSAPGRKSPIAGDGASASTTGTEKTSTRAAAIRKLLQDEQQRSVMSPLFARLQRTALKTALFVCTLACAAFVYWQSALALFIRNIQFVSLLGIRRYCLITLAYATHSLWMHNHDILPNNDTSSISLARGQLAWAGQKLKDVDTQLFQTYMSYESDDLHTLYATDSVEFLTLDNDEVHSGTYSAYELTLKLASLAAQAVSEPLETFEEGNPLMFALMNNVQSSQSVLNKTFASVEAFEQVARSSLSSIFVSFTVANSLLALTMIAVGLSSLKLGPLIGDNGSIVRTKREVLSVFLTISKDTTEKIIGRLTQRLTVIHDENDGLFMTEEEEQDKERRGSRATVGTVELEAETTLIRERAHEPKKSKHSRRKFNYTSERSCSRKLCVMLKMGSLLIIGSVFFACNFVAVQSLMPILRPAARTENLAGLQRMRLRHATHSLRMFVTGCYKNSTFVFNETSVSFAMGTVSVHKVINALEAVHNTLLYGDDTGLVSGIFTGTLDASKSDLLELYTMDGCYSWPASQDKPVAHCRSYMKGIMESGLHVAVEAYANYAKRRSRVYSVMSREMLQQLFDHGEFSQFLELELDYLQTQAGTAVRMQSQSIVYRIERTNSFLLALLVGFIAATGLCYSLLVRRVLQQLDKEVKHTRSLLLLIPEDVLEASPQIQKVFVNSFSKR